MSGGCGHRRSGTTTLFLRGGSDCRRLPRLLLKHAKMNSEASDRRSPATEITMSTSVFTLLPEPPAGGPSGGAIAPEPGWPLHVPEGEPDAGMITVRPIGGGRIW